jgi:hypothetical protein
MQGDIEIQGVAFPTPVLSGSGEKGVISARMGTPKHWLMQGKDK